MKHILLTTVTLGALMGSAQAQDFDWTGFYVGVHGGIALGGISDLSGFGFSDEGEGVGVPLTGLEDDNEPFTFMQGTGGLGSVTQYVDQDEELDSANGAFGGVHVGYVYQFDSLAFGIEADFSISAIGSESYAWETWDRNIEYTNWNLEIYEEFYLDSMLDVKLDNFGTVRGKIGAPMGRFMPFVTGGVAFGSSTVTRSHDISTSSAWGQINFDFADGTYSGPVCLNAGAPSSCEALGAEAIEPFSDSSSANHVGYAIGAGVSYAVTDSIVVTGEYSYMNLGKHEVESMLSGGQDLAITLDSHTVRGGISFKF